MSYVTMLLLGFAGGWFAREAFKALIGDMPGWSAFFAILAIAFFAAAIVEIMPHAH